MDSPLRRARKARKETLQAVAAAVDSDTGNLSRIERGKQVASPDLAERLARHFSGEVTEMQIIYPERFADPADDTNLPTDE